ncbi:MAG TPA: tetratricopeptide repeat protein [Acidobacteriota bacterium]|nr:tetratricopeptide repeat protein [Acidobacteriota bacterium]
MAFIERLGPAFSATPSDPKAAKHYAEALESLRIMDAFAARNLLHKAVAIDPADPLIHAALAETLAILGHTEKAREEAKIAYGQSANLPREMNLLIEGMYREFSNDWDKAIQIYRSLLVFYPDHFACSFRLAMVLTQSGRGQEAQTVLDALKRSGGEDAEDPRIDFAEALAADSLTDFTRKVDAAKRAASKLSSNGSSAARLMVARARMMEAAGYTDLGEPKKAEEILQQVRQILQTEGDQDGLARLNLTLGNVHRRKGDVQSAKKMFEESLTIFKSIGDRNGESAALNCMANTDRILGYLAVARTLYESALEASRDIGDRIGVVRALIGIANVFLQEGDLEGAKKRFTEALQISKKSGYCIGHARIMNNLAEIHHFQGKLSDARVLYEEVLRMKEEMGDRSSLAFTLFDLGKVLFAQGLLEESRERFKASLAIREAIGEKGAAAESRLALAAILLEEGEIAKADAIANQAVEIFRDEMRSDYEAFALTLHSRCLLENGMMLEAVEIAEYAMAVNNRNKGLRNYLLVMLQASQVRASTAQPSYWQEALTRIQSVLDEATHRGFVDIQLEARFAIAEIQLKYGKHAEGKEALAAIEKEARPKGFGLIASRCL